MEALICWPSLALQLTIATGNPTKVAEIEAMLGPLPINVQRQPDDLDVEETGSTYRENAELKASAAALRTNGWALADDSGLEVDSLQCAPGLFSARYAEGNDAKIQRILSELGASLYRSACFRSTMVLCDPTGNCRAAAEGICWGELLNAPAYPDGGFESLLWVREARCTYGELNPAQLSRLGSRGKAARALAPQLRQLLGLN
ncbi:Ham1 protein-like protein [Synechococcus sp. WH 8109]|uniref:non-canonical purine NTP pyrophosphatase n=1 Tax=Synechococcus sp. WH 8109 TaxID=166314 RepID=UPI0001B8D28C|nr:non-canonical purine NTP pyrophosphatase [Synechococcus sp. WH 8109]AHF64301.1 Ham1 protein-like protein [Synechococcus sp. WH 8109]